MTAEKNFLMLTFLSVYPTAQLTKHEGETNRNTIEYGEELLESKHRDDEPELKKSCEFSTVKMMMMTIKARNFQLNQKTRTNK